MRPRENGCGTECRIRSGWFLFDLGLVNLGAGLAERLVVDRLPGLVAVGQGLVEVRAKRIVVLRETDAVLLGRERLAHNLEVVGVVRRVTDKDRLVGRDRVNLALLQLVDTLRVGCLLYTSDAADEKFAV